MWRPADSFFRVLSCLLALLLTACARQPATPPVRIGVVHSQTGTMAISERPLIAAIELAVAEINAAGGLLGQPVELHVADGRSDNAVFAREAERLIVEARVDVLFACWTSACRQAVRPVVERHRHLMFYPVQYEGLESSPHLIYTGAAPNQQIVPGTRWAVESLGRRLYLLGSDYVFPRIANTMMRDLARTLDAEVVAERYVPLGSREVAAVIDEIRRQRPDVLLNTLNGDSNAALFDALVQAGLADLPVVSFSVAEPELTAWGGGRLHRHYGVWNYFQSLPGEMNRQFVASLRARLGAGGQASDAAEASYVGVHLWANAVRAAGVAEPATVNTALLLRQTLGGPSGVVAIDAATRHVWKRARIGRVDATGQYQEVFASTRPLRPEPWPHYHPRDVWQAIIGDLAGNPT